MIGQLKRQSQRGFTLIELLAGIAIFALISASLYGAFGISLRSFDSAGRRTDADQQMRLVSAFLQRSLEQGNPLALVDRGRWQLLFDGNRTALRYVANLPGYLGFGGFYEMAFKLEHEPGHQRLLLERRPLVVDKVRGEIRGDLQKQVLLADLQSLQFRYYGIAGSEVSPAWHEIWPQSRQLPLLIEARIVDVQGRAWPPVVARIRVNQVRFQMAQGSSGRTLGGTTTSTQVLN